jgi:hypothetical protein
MSAEWWVAVVELVQGADTELAHLGLVAGQEAANEVLARVLIYLEVSNGVCGNGPRPYRTVVEVAVALQLTTDILRTIVTALRRDGTQALRGVQLLGTDIYHRFALAFVEW